ncbi:MAG: hypothetical protein ACYDBR_07965, partial [Gaiellaceae bacterium]
RFAVARLAVLRLAVLRFAVARLAVLRLAVLRFAVARLAVLRLAVLRFAVARLAVLRLAVARFAVARLAVLRLAVERFAVLRFAVERFAVLRPDERRAPDLFCGVAICVLLREDWFCGNDMSEYVVYVGCFQHGRLSSFVLRVDNCPMNVRRKRINTHAHTSRARVECCPCGGRSAMNDDARRERRCDRRAALRHAARKASMSTGE